MLQIKEMGIDLWVNNTLIAKEALLWLCHHPFNSPPQGGALGDISNI